MPSSSLRDAQGGTAGSSVKPGGESAVGGSGKVVLAPSGSGGTFTIKATTANGAAIIGTIQCSAFKAAIAEGGN